MTGRMEESITLQTLAATSGGWNYRLQEVTPALGSTDDLIYGGRFFFLAFNSEGWPLASGLMPRPRAPANE
jgi:hypothetical protein